AESVPYKASYCCSFMDEDACMFEDATVLKDDAKRKCRVHGQNCELPDRVDAFGAGFSCTSYSMLNKNASENATAMTKSVNQDPSGNVASVTTFHGCLDVLDECSPVWAVFENVESIDREVDDDTQTNLELCLAAIADRGYASQSFLLDALWFGLPQSRRRVYIVCLSIRDRNVGCSAEDFLSNVQSIITKLYLQSPPADKFLLPDTHALVKGHLRSLEADRQQRLAKEQEQDTSKAHPKNPSWMALHMNVAEKRGITWPLNVCKQVKESPWFRVLTERAQEVVGFASDERERLGKPVDYADVYHSASRYSTGRGNFPIVLPRTIGWTFLRQRLVLGRELMMFQGHSVSADCDLTEAQLGNMAGNAFAGNVVIAVVTAVLGSLRFVSESEDEETNSILDLVNTVTG
ncbi:unnamed protein product, partial [Durusdinium trenchii]